MKTIDKTLIPTLEIAIKESLQNYESRNDDNSLGDLYLHYDKEENTLFIYDDGENLLNEVQFPKDQIFSVGTLRYMLQQPEHAQLFEKEYIFKPFSVSLVDKDLIVLEEIYFLDNDTIKLGGDIWDSMEKDLDDFLKNLLQ
jgi:hypothetical protein